MSSTTGDLAGISPELFAQKALPDLDTTPVIQDFKSVALRRLCTLLSAFMTGKFSYQQFLAELSDEDIRFINKNAVAGFREMIEIGIEIPDMLGNKLVLTQGDVKLNLKREDIQKRLTATISPKAQEAVKTSMSEGQTGYMDLIKHLKENLTPQNVAPTVNKNAYEIRLDILKQAISMSGGNVETALELADKLYRFVEGPKRR
jgi:hypothetical protein